MKRHKSVRFSGNCRRICLPWRWESTNGEVRKKTGDQIRQRGKNHKRALNRNIETCLLETQIQKKNCSSSFKIERHSTEMYTNRFEFHLFAHFFSRIIWTMCTLSDTKAVNGVDIFFSRPGEKKRSMHVQHIANAKHPHRTALLCQSNVC